MALGDSKKKYPDIWLGYDSDHLIVGLQSVDWDLVKILVHVRPADAYLKSLEGYSYQLLSQHDDQGFLGLTLKPIGIKTQETGVSLPRSYHKDMSKGAGVQCAWFIHKSHLKGWSPKDHSSFELAVCWSVSSQKKSLGWPSKLHLNLSRVDTIGPSVFFKGSYATFFYDQSSLAADE